VVLLLSWTRQHLRTLETNTNVQFQCTNVLRRLFSEICSVSLFLLQQRVLTGPSCAW